MNKKEAADLLKRYGISKCIWRTIYRITRAARLSGGVVKSRFLSSGTERRKI